MFMNNFNVHFIFHFVNKTFICSVASCTPLQHPISEVFVHSKSYIVCFFYYPKHCTLCNVSWQIQGVYVIKVVVFGEMRNEMCFVSSMDTCFCGHRLVCGSLTLC
jgi:hypothetical protein